jgi:nitrous oxidase accessory protein NosD
MKTATRSTLITLTLAATMVALPHQAFAVDRLVPSQYATIQAAIDAAAAGDVVQIAPGTYPGPINFNGKAITVRGATDPSTVLISGGTTGSPVVRFGSGESGTSVLEGVTITGGRSYQNGGGIAIENSSPVIRDCRIIGNISGVNDISGNSLGGFGAGILIRYAAPVITNCFVAGNTGKIGSGPACGGGIYVYGPSAARIQTCTITGNKLEGGINNFGAGVFVEGTSASAMPTFEDCVISGNSLISGGDGAAIHLGGPATLTRCKVSGNTCSSSYGCGTVNRITAAQVSLRDCYFCGTNSTITGPFVDLGGNRFPQTCDACAGDLDGDGKVDGADLAILLSKWGACPN